MTISLWQSLFHPLLRLLLGLISGLLLANLLEAMNWTAKLARFSRPFARAAHLSVIGQAAFTMAFLSPSAANAFLSEKHRDGRLSLRELFIANLLNSLPANLLHLPTLFLMMWPVVGWAALMYVGLSLTAAFLRCLFVFFAARRLLPAQKLQSEASNISFQKTGGIGSAFAKAFLRLKRRLPKLLLWTIPVYILMYVLEIEGVFAQLKIWLAESSIWSDFLSPQAAGIIVLHFLAELGSALGAAGSLLAAGGINENEVVLALLLGNILSTPIRALRHQLPSYAGLFSPSLGFRLILTSQSLRALTMILVTVVYLFSNHSL